MRITISTDLTNLLLTTMTIPMQIGISTTPETIEAPSPPPTTTRESTAIMVTILVDPLSLGRVTKSKVTPSNPQTKRERATIFDRSQHHTIHLHPTPVHRTLLGHNPRVSTSLTRTKAGTTHPMTKITAIIAIEEEGATQSQANHTSERKSPTIVPAWISSMKMCSLFQESQCQSPTMMPAWIS